MDNGLKANEIGYLPSRRGAKDFPARPMRSSFRALSRQHPGLFYTKTDKDAAKENLTRLGIGSFAANATENWSGGQHQRVLLPGPLRHGEMLLLDEPVQG